MFQKLRNEMVNQASSPFGSSGDNSARENDNDALKVIIYASELQKITELASQYENIETGGDFFGFWTQSGAPVVQYVIGPGKNCARSSTSFFQDTDYLTRVHAHLYKKHGLQNIGEWHSHHKMNMNKPSGGDESTLRKGLAKHGWSKFLIMIATLGPGLEQVVNQNYFIITSENSRPRPLRIVVLEGQSPIRTLENNIASQGNEPALPNGARWQWKPGPYTPETASAVVKNDYSNAWFREPAFQQFLKKILLDFTSNNFQPKMELTPQGEVILRFNESDGVIIPGCLLSTECIFFFEKGQSYESVILRNVSYEKYFDLLRKVKTMVIAKGGAVNEVI
jgi:hypothetical protein